MIRVRSLALAFAACLSFAAASHAGAATGYLDPARVPDAATAVGPPPAPGTAEAKADARAFKVTRKLAGSERWSLAQHDNAPDAPTVLADFDCAIGARLDAANAPRLLALIERVKRDASATINPAKAVFKRPRPIEGNHAPTCVDRSQITGFAYPSGHSGMIGTIALVLAELAPDRAGPIVARGRVFAESRVVCGAHWPTDIEAGQRAGAVLVATLHADPFFRADMEAARAEVAAARAAPQAPDAGMCRIEQAALQRPW